jgi:hypothetical protein
VLSEIEDPVGTAPREAGAVYHVGLFVQNRFQQFGILLRVVFEVSILNDDDLTSRLGESTADSRAFPSRTGAGQLLPA